MQKLSDQLYVSPQINLEDIPLIKQRGIRTVLCNRPDGEEEGQISQELIAGQCRIHGLDYFFQPVQTSSINDDDVARFTQLLNDAQTPILAYCRTGTRCTILWALSQREHLTDAEIFQRANQAGYDLSLCFPSDSSE